MLKDFGVELDSSKKVAIWDSSAQVRFFVIPQRPEGTDHFSEEQLAALVSTEAMQGLGLVSTAQQGA